MPPKITFEDMIAFLKENAVVVKKDDAGYYVVVYEVFFNHDGKMNIENSFFTKKDAHEYTNFINRSTYYFYKKLEVNPYQIFEDRLKADEETITELYKRYKGRHV